MRYIRQFKNTPATFGWVSILLHWLVALVVLGMYPLGLFIVSLSYYDPGYRIYPDWHRSIGVLLMLLLCLRIVWRWINPSPRQLSRHRWEQWAASLGHLGIYLLLITILSSGYLFSTADGRSIQVFNWFSLPAIPGLALRQEELAADIHFYAATLLMLLVGVHALAALKHHFIDKDATLTRMLGLQSEKLDDSN